MHKAALAAALSAAIVGGTLAEAAAVLHPMHNSGQVEYLSGGIGQDEAKAIKTASGQWPLMLESAGGKTLHEKVRVKHGQPAKAVFVWPARTGESRP